MTEYEIAEPNSNLKFRKRIRLIREPGLGRKHSAILIEIIPAHTEREFKFGPYPPGILRKHCRNMLVGCGLNLRIEQGAHPGVDPEAQANTR